MSMRNPEAGEIRLTLAGKLLIFLVGLGILAFAGWTYRDRLPFSLPSLSSGGSSTDTTPAPSGEAATNTGVLARIKETGTLKVGMEPDAAPLHFVNDKK